MDVFIILFVVLLFSFIECYTGHTICVRKSPEHRCQSLTQNNLNRVSGGIKRIDSGWSHFSLESDDEDDDSSIDSTICVKNMEHYFHHDRRLATPSLTTTSSSSPVLSHISDEDVEYVRYRKDSLDIYPNSRNPAELIKVQDRKKKRYLSHYLKKKVATVRFCVELYNYVVLVSNQ